MTDFYSSKEINLDIFSDLCNQSVLPGDYPVATAVESNVIIYQRDALYEALIDENRKRLVQRELHNCLRHGPGVFVIRNFYNNNRIVDESTNIFRQIIDEEQAGNENTGDHFANAGENERIWNSFQKVCERNPQSFIEYYKNPLYTLVSESWLGPGYQMSAQVNVVKPGGKAQAAHRDYHLGFQSEKVIQRFPLPLQVASQYLTLQGAIAHTDMPPQTGPTMLLPFSQQYELGYLAWR
ncbi:MAG: phytanoyl-CoA dioxygenase family protein, partial [Saprospiraceae bacterium]|nr:phytanoyl-CoA dioxygenase family protein [Saprospiraceae bacterium]